MKSLQTSFFAVGFEQNMWGLGRGDLRHQDPRLVSLTFAWHRITVFMIQISTSLKNLLGAYIWYEIL